MTVVPPNRKEKDLAELSSLGHFLKGSSATLGLTKVKVCRRNPPYPIGAISGTKPHPTGLVREDPALRPEAR